MTVQREITNRYNFDYDYHAYWLEEGQRSASVIVPIILNYFPWINSVLDVGCGPGAWLAEFEALGVGNILGLDGSDIPSELMQVRQSQFMRVDFLHEFCLPSRFDVAISLEVADCLPQSSSEKFVKHLTSFSDLVIFSAAVPNQSGRNDTNGRWPSYWISLFSQQGFCHFDLFRPLLWYDQRVSWWYAQNIFIFVNEFRQDLVGSCKSRSSYDNCPLDIAHPFNCSKAEVSSYDEFDELMYYPFVLLEQDFFGFNILRIGNGKFLALGQSEGAYHPEKLRLGDYDHAYIGELMEAVKAFVASSVYCGAIRKKSVRGYDIYELGVGLFVGVPRGEGGRLFECLVKGKLDRVYFANSVKGIRRKISWVDWVRSIISQRIFGSKSFGR